MKKNPNFNREELILCLDLYFKMDYGQMHGSNPAIIKLSEDLRALDLHKNIANINTFRSINSVSLKLANFKRLDGNFKGKGMKMGGEMDKDIWNEFYKHREKLKNEADIIRQVYLKPKSKIQSEVKYKSEFFFDFHKNRETDPLFMKIKKEMALATTNKLNCEVCGFDSQSFYGEVGDDLMEVHFELKNEPTLDSTEIKDSVIVCSNCHKVLDKNFGLLYASDLKKLIKKTK
ncbi:hypothetical protein [Chryseobacterium aquifrigidense]|uniref:HNH endonuclease n=1 Tax=Chryseobacterium aquifrigidense TaxID=558021 RepID=A0A543EHJ1_9FLAO|nr:hypothetical protein [Chryseobacterium aquifrigidense]TQM21060.1 hypothetical protein FB551_0741 [Chryseobacterium aquifrigidense]